MTTMAQQQWKQYLQAEMDFAEPLQSTVDHICHVYMQERLKNEGTISSARTIIKHIRRHLGEATLAILVEKPHVLVRFFRDFPEKKWSPKYVYNYRLCLRAAISYYMKSRNIGNIANPMNVVFLDPETAIREVVPTPYEYQRIILEAEAEEIRMEEQGKMPHPYIADFITAAWETGLRKGEVLAWNWSGMDMTFLNGLPAYTVWISKQKRKFARQIPMTRELYETMYERWCAAGRPTKGAVWPVLNSPNKILKRVFKAADCKHLTIHDFRKAYKTMRKAEGWTTEQTMAVQGHATESMDNYYTIFQRKDLEPLFQPSWNKPLDSNRKLVIMTGTEG